MFKCFICLCLGYKVINKDESGIQRGRALKVTRQRCKNTGYGRIYEHLYNLPDFKIKPEV